MHGKQMLPFCADKSVSRNKFVPGNSSLLGTDTLPNGSFPCECKFPLQKGIFRRILGSWGGWGEGQVESFSYLCWFSC